MRFCSFVCNSVALYHISHLWNHVDCNILCDWITFRATVILGYLPQELLGTSVYEYYHQDDIPSMGQVHRKGTSISLSLSVCLSPVSYTHLTLPTTAEV